jgi:hypothetical protein
MIFAFFICFSLVIALALGFGLVSILRDMVERHVDEGAASRLHRR